MALLVVVALEVAWLAAHPGEVDAYDIVVLACAGWIAVSPSRAAQRLGRLTLGAAFGLSVMDRFGLLGEAGANGVSWGDYDAFLDYTRRLIGVLPDATVPWLGAAATAAETVASVLLLAGRRFAAVSTPLALGLLVVFGTAMTLTLGPTSPFEYHVWALAGITLTGVTGRRARSIGVDGRLS